MPVAVSAAGELCAKPLSYAVRLVNEAKVGVDMEYMQSVADLMVRRGRVPCVRRHQGRVRRPGFLVGQAGIRRFGQI